MLWNSLVALFAPVVSDSAAVQSPLAAASLSSASRTGIFDIQAHRGGRGNVVENTLPAFAWALINGANTLELDNGITKDGHVIVWHDEDIVPEKCWDTAPAFEDDPDYPYAGKVVADLTLAQIKTLDCGSQRQATYPLQATYPGTRISTLQEFFDFVSCADPEHQMKFNIESKINPEQPNKTRGPEEFVSKQHEIFSVSPYAHAITYQSFDWRSLVLMKKLDPRVLLSGLVDDETISVPGRPSVWFGGMQVDDFPGQTRTAKLSQMAASMGLHILSPVATGRHSPTKETNQPGYIPFVDEPMVREAHRAGVLVKPWTVNTLSVAERLMELGVDGLISDYPDAIRRWVKGRGLPVASRYPSSRVLACLAQHNQLTTPSHLSTQSTAVGAAVNDSQSAAVVDSDSVPAPPVVTVVVAAGVSST